jgi:predicted flap endonuclease-1-like 5' DNA nuclease
VGDRDAGKAGDERGQDQSHGHPLAAAGGKLARLATTGKSVWRLQSLQGRKSHEISPVTLLNPALTEAPSHPPDTFRERAMGAYYDLVLNSVCRSNHHRIAVMALDHLKGDDAELWRNLFLKWHETYLKGAKAPDEEFKDFKNHVVHPKDNFWGGAPKAAAEWYKRTLRALTEGDWEHAAWSAGVMSHYIADPHQPFHTDQCEAEGVIHRAAEWSFSKAFPEIKLIIEQHVGWPELKMPEGDNWMEQIVHNGALRANPHYHTLIDHYNLDAGRKKPELALDQESKDIVADLIAHATMAVSLTLQRAFAESKARPPKVGLTLSTIFVSCKTPLHSMLKTLDHQEDAKIVAAQYEEFRRTGKVKETLGEDDKIVRALHANEVQDVHISTLDCEWPREHGLAHGEGAEARVHKKIKPTKVKAAKPAKAEVDTGEETPATGNEANTPAPEKPAPTPSSKAPRIRLTRDASVVDAPSIGPKTANRFQVIGVKTVGEFLALSPDEAAQKIKASHINARIIKDWQAQALLACSVPDITGTTAQMLVGAGVTTATDLAGADPAHLLKAIADFSRTKEGEGALRGAAPPDQSKIEKWIASAKSLSQAA